MQENSKLDDIQNEDIQFTTIKKSKTIRRSIVSKVLKKTKSTRYEGGDGQTGPRLVPNLAVPIDQNAEYSDFDKRKGS